MVWLVVFIIVIILILLLLEFLKNLPYVIFFKILNLGFLPSGLDIE